MLRELARLHLFCKKVHYHLPCSRTISVYNKRSSLLDDIIIFVRTVFIYGNLDRYFIRPKTQWRHSEKQELSIEGYFLAKQQLDRNTRNFTFYFLLFYLNFTSSFFTSNSFCCRFWSIRIILSSLFEIDRTHTCVTATSAPYGY